MTGCQNRSAGIWPSSFNALQGHLPTDSQPTQHARYQNKPPPQHATAKCSAHHSTPALAHAAPAPAHVRRLTRVVPQEESPHTHKTGGWSLETRLWARVCAGDTHTHTPAQHSDWQRQQPAGPCCELMGVRGTARPFMSHKKHACRVSGTASYGVGCTLSAVWDHHHHHHRRRQPGDAYCRDTAAGAGAAVIHSSMQLWGHQPARDNCGTHGPLQTQGPCVVHGILHSTHAVERRSRPRGLGCHLTPTRAPTQTTHVSVADCGAAARSKLCCSPSGGRSQQASAAGERQWHRP